MQEREITKRGKEKLPCSQELQPEVTFAFPTPFRDTQWFWAGSVPTSLTITKAALPKGGDCEMEWTVVFGRPEYMSYGTFWP